MEEIKRILNDETVITEAKGKWKYYISQIIKQAQLEKGAVMEKNK